MRLKIDTSEVMFRVAATATRKEFKDGPANDEQGRPIWGLRLTAIEASRGTAETIWVNVAGEQPILTVDEVVQAPGLTYAPYISKKTGRIVRQFRADAITPPDQASRKSAA